MKTLIVNNLSVFTFPLIIFFRILNFKILFVSIEKYFRSKTLLNCLSLINIKWFNYQEYKINHIEIEKFRKSIPFSDILSTDISNKFWSSYLHEIYENKYCLNVCLNKRIYRESRQIIEIFEIAKSLKDINNRIFLWVPNTLISRKVNAEFYQFKNLNFFPNLKIFNTFVLLLVILTKTIKSFLITQFKNRKISKYDKKILDQKYQNFKIVYFPHKGIFYANLYIKDYFYSHDNQDPFFCEKILHIEYLINDLSRKGRDFYKQKNIQYLIFKDLSNNFNILKKMIFFLIKNYKLVFKLAKFDFEILNFFFYSSFLVIQNIQRLGKLKNLKLVLVGHDVPFPKEISAACKKKNIKTIAMQDRVATAYLSSLMIFDYYFVGGERSKNLIKKRMPSPFIDNLLNLYMVKTDKYAKLNSSNSLKNNFSNEKLKCLVVDLHSLRSWYYNGRAPVNSWRRNKDFYHEIINLAEHFPQVEFLIKSKQYDWLDIPYFKEISRQLYQKKNIGILSDQKKWTPIRSVNACDFAISLYSSLSDEMLAIGKPVIIIDKFGQPEKYFNFGKILAKNYDETIKKINLIIEDYKKYNFQIEEDRNKIYYKNQPGKLNIELNKIFLAHNNH